MQLVVQSTGVADLLSCSVPPPQRGRRCLTVHALSSFSLSRSLETHQHYNLKPDQDVDSSAPCQSLWSLTCGTTERVMRVCCRHAAAAAA